MLRNDAMCQSLIFGQGLRRPAFFASRRTHAIQ
jgi:hypothetical protein